MKKDSGHKMVKGKKVLKKNNYKHPREDDKKFKNINFLRESISLCVESLKNAVIISNESFHTRKRVQALLLCN